jgi:hypothetical protein
MRLYLGAEPLLMLLKALDYFIHLAGPSPVSFSNRRMGGLGKQIR